MTKRITLAEALSQFVTQLEALGYPGTTQLVNADFQVRLKLPGGITSAHYEYPDPGENHDHHRR
jgi:hypothetical protein